MFFSNYLNQLMNDLGITNTELAKAIKVSQSYISRIRNGSRTPSPGGKLHQKIYYGLQGIINQREDIPPQAAKLLPGHYEAFLEASICNFQISEFSFDHFNQIMNQLEISNQELARNIFCDESLVSKYRTGERLPKDPLIYPLIVAFFTEKIMESDQREDLLEMLDCKSKNSKGLENAVFNFLFTEKRDSDFILSMLSTLEQRPTFSLDYAQLSGLIQNISLPSQKVNIKKGRQGLRKHFFAALATCAKMTAPLEIMMYSNQNIQWMLEDRKYFETWRFLMMAVLQKGHHITIVHHLERSDLELSAIIEGWIPLHLSGNTRLYYHEDRSSLPFKHSLFVAKGLLSITGSAIEEMDQEACYALIQDDQKNKIIEAAFDRFLDQSQILLHSKQARDYGKIVRLLETTDPLSRKMPFYCIQTNLPFWTLEADLLIKILEKNQVSPEKRTQILAWLKQIKGFYQHQLVHNEIFEAFYLPSMIPINRIPLDIPSFSDRDQPIYYQAEDYIAHFQMIVEKTKTDPRFHVAIIKQPKFDDVKLVQYGQDHVLAMNFSSPVHLINYRHKALQQSIKNYIQDLVHHNLKTTDQLDGILMEMKE